jgi:glucokinase
MNTLGIDLGGTKVVIAVAKSQGRVLAERRRPTEPTGDPRTDVERIAADAEQLLAETGIARGSLGAVGISAPGPLDAGRGAVLRPPNLPGWDDVPVCRWLEDRLGAPVRLENDANAAALAEHRWGAGQGCRDMVYLTMSTGVGAGLILDGRLHHGASGNAGEVGHLPVEWNGEPCACGRRGCLEAYVGGAAWTRRLRQCAPATGRVAALAGGVDRITPEHVIEAAREGDPFASAEVERYDDWLARGIVALSFVLAPERVVLGTIPTAAGALCFDPVRRKVREAGWPMLVDELEIVPAALGDRGPALAALAVAWEQGA